VGKENEILAELARRYKPKRKIFRFKKPRFSKEEIRNEIWRPVKGWEKYYSVSNLGRVRREGYNEIDLEKVFAYKIVPHKKIITPIIQDYCEVLTVRLWKKKDTHRSVRKLVWDAFGDYPANKIKLKDQRDIYNCRIENLVGVKKKKKVKKKKRKTDGKTQT
jgi:hypothetical protein